MEVAIDSLVITVLGGPLLLALVGLVGLTRRFPRVYREVTVVGCVLVALAALAIAILVLRSGPIDRSLFTSPGWPIGVGVYIDALSAVMLVLTAGIGFVACRFSLRYLDGDPGQTRFLAWTVFTFGAVLYLLCMRNLAAFVLFWCFVSAGLHQLLTFYPERPAAMRAAWKKFLISRLGDTCLITGIILAWLTFGTLELPDLFRLAATSESDTQTAWMAFFFVLGAMTKSAQFPFHTWLPETMDSPTPLSALMHAGIINAGGYLIVRLSPLVVHSPLAMDVLMVNGALTAMLGSIVMLTQTDIKRSLAFSTISQMGFMMMQCGLGAFSAAVLHIVTHGLYKAHAFLGAGTAASWSAKRQELSPGRALLYGTFSLVIAAALVYLGIVLTGIPLLGKPGGLVIATFLTAGVSVLVLHALSESALGPFLRVVVASSGLLLVLVYLGAWKIMDSALSPFLQPSLAGWVPTTFDQVFSLVVMGFTATALFIGWMGGPIARSALGRRLYVLALNGFHIADLIGRHVAPHRGAAKQPDTRVAV
ncbi:MAG: proton-conducting transporter membrane subunit [Gemmataceae bacterium]